MGKRIIERPWQVVASDIMGPLPRSKNGFRYILVFQDLFTRWIEVTPLRKADGEGILRELNRKVILRFGKPEVFISDNGTEYRNKLASEVLESLGIHHTFTPTYSPRANPVERVNRSVKTMIASYVEENHSTWDEHLEEITFAYNTAEHSSTKMSPAMLNYGRQPDPPSMVMAEQNMAAMENLEQSAISKWHERMANFGEILNKAKENSELAHDTQAKYFNKNRREAEFVEGDVVWVRNEILSSAKDKISKKCAPKFRGPFLITKTLGTNTYCLIDENGDKESPVSADKLKMFVQGEDPEEEEETNTEEENKGETPKENEKAMSDPPASEITSPAGEDNPAVVVKRKVGRPKKKRSVPVRNKIVRENPIAQVGKRKVGRPKKTRE